MKLDADFIRKLELPEKGAKTYWDSDPKLTGFGIRVYASGVKSFFINYRIGGRERRYTIGPFPRWSVAAARERALELRKLIDQGGDPAGDKRERRDAPTIQDLTDRYLEEHAPKKALSAKARANDERRMLELIGSHLGKHSKVADIHGGDIANMHRRISESPGRGGKPRPKRANRVLSIASKMFSLSLVPQAGENTPWRNAAMGNPCKGIARNHEQGRERFFGPNELTRISDALAAYDGPAADCIKLVMLTGCRPAEAMKAEWTEFDAEPGYWIKPSAHTKQRRVHKLPLSPAALELIARLRERRKGGKWLFPGDRPGEHLAAIWYCWARVRERAELSTDARIYDLRHTFASVGAGGGLSLPIIGRLLGHTQPGTTQRYAHLADDPLRQAAEKITTVITGAGKPAAKIVGIKGRP
jgi:integrase